MLAKVKRVLESVLVQVTSLMLVVMLGLAIMQVFSRYVLKAPAIYTEELLRFIMIWMGFLGSAYAFGLNQHLNLVFLSERLSSRGKKILATINGLIVVLFALFILLWGGIKMVSSGMTQVSPILQIKMGYVFLILPFSAILIALLQSVNLLLLWEKSEDPEPGSACVD